MNEHDETLASPAQSAATPFGNPNGSTPRPLRQMTIDEVLASATRTIKVARVCVRADLASRHEELVRELASLVDANGELLEDPEASMGEQGAAARAQELNDQITALGREMAGATWTVRFQGMPDDEWPVWLKKHKPDDDAKMQQFYNELIAAVAIEPKLSVEQVAELRKKFGFAQMAELTTKAWQACTSGGVDIPKLPFSLRNLTRQPSDES